MTTLYPKLHDYSKAYDISRLSATKRITIFVKTYGYHTMAKVWPKTKWTIDTKYVCWLQSAINCAQFPLCFKTIKTSISAVPSSYHARLSTGYQKIITDFN